MNAMIPLKKVCTILLTIQGIQKAVFSARDHDKFTQYFQIIVERTPFIRKVEMKSGKIEHAPGIFSYVSSNNNN